MKWLFYGLLYLMSIRPVIMTASRRDCLVNDAEALDLAMEVIRELRAKTEKDEVLVLDGGPLAATETESPGGKS